MTINVTHVRSAFRSAVALIVLFSVSFGTPVALRAEEDQETLSDREAIARFLKERLASGRRSPIRYYTSPPPSAEPEPASETPRERAKTAADEGLVDRSYRTAPEGAASPESEFKAFMAEVERIAAGAEPSGHDVLKLLETPAWRDRLIKATLSTLGPNGEGAPKAIKELIKSKNVPADHGKLMWFARNELIRQAQASVLEILKQKHPDLHFDLTALDSGTAGSVKSDVDKTPWLTAWDADGNRVSAFGENGRVGNIHDFVRLFYDELNKIGQTHYEGPGRAGQSDASDLIAKCLDVEFFASDTLPRELGLARTHLEGDPFRIAVDQQAADFRVLQRNPGPTYQTLAAILAQVLARAVDADAQLQFHLEALEKQIADWAKVPANDRVGLLLDHAVDIIHSPATTMTLDENGKPRMGSTDVMTFLERNGLATRFDRKQAVMNAVANYEKLLPKIQKARSAEDFIKIYHGILNDLAKYLSRVNQDTARALFADNDPNKPKVYGDLDRAFVPENARARHGLQVEPLGRPYTKEVHVKLYRKALAKLYGVRPESADAGRTIHQDMNLYWAVHRAAENVLAVKADEELGRKKGSRLAAQGKYPDDIVLKPVLDHLIIFRPGFDELPSEEQLLIARRTMVSASETGPIVLIGGRLDEVLQSWLTTDRYELRRLKATERRKQKRLKKELKRLATQADDPDGQRARRTWAAEEQLRESRNRLEILEEDPLVAKRKMETVGIESLRRIHHLFKRKGNTEEYKRMLQLLPEADRQTIALMERVWDAEASEREKAALEEHYKLKPPSSGPRHGSDPTSRMARAYMEDFGVDIDAFFARQPQAAAAGANAKTKIMKRFLQRNYVNIGLADSGLQIVRTLQLARDLPWEEQMAMLGHTVGNEFIMGIPFAGPVYTTSLGWEADDWVMTAGGMMTLGSEMARLYMNSYAAALEEAMIAAGQGGRAAALARMAALSNYAVVGLSLARVGVEIVGEEAFYPIDQQFLQLVMQGYLDDPNTSRLIKYAGQRLQPDIPVTPIAALDNERRDMTYLYLKPAQATALLEDLMAGGKSEAATALLHLAGMDENMDRTIPHDVVIDLSTDYRDLIQQAQAQSFGSLLEPPPPALQRELEKARQSAVDVWTGLAALQQAVRERTADDRQLKTTVDGHDNLWLLASRQNLATSVQERFDREAEILYQAMVGVPQAMDTLAAEADSDWLPAGRGQTLPMHVAKEISGVLDTKARFQSTQQSYKERIEELGEVPWGMPQDMLQEYVKRQTQAWFEWEDDDSTARKQEADLLRKKLDVLQVFLSNSYVDRRTPTEPYRLDEAMAWYSARMEELRKDSRQMKASDTLSDQEKLRRLQKNQAEELRLHTEITLLVKGFYEAYNMVAPKIAQQRLRDWLAGRDPFNNAVHTALTFVWHDAKVQGAIRRQLVSDLLQGLNLRHEAEKQFRTYRGLLDAAAQEASVAYARITEDRVRQGFEASLEWAELRAESRERMTMFDGDMQVHVDPYLLVSTDEQGNPTLDAHAAIKVDHDVTRAAVPQVTCKTTMLTRDELADAVPAEELEMMLEQSGLDLKEMLFGYRITAEVEQAPPMEGYEDRAYEQLPNAVTRYILVPGKVDVEDKPELAPEATAAVQAFPVKPDAPDEFPMENAIDHCAMDAESVNVHDEVVVFFTPKRDLSDERPEKWRYQVRDPEGNRMTSGDWRLDADGKPVGGSPVRMRAGSPGKLAVARRLGFHRRPPGEYVLETVALKPEVAARLFGQGAPRYVPDGDWREEGRFEVRDGWIHFQGFVAEPTRNRPMPRRTTGVKRWKGTLNMEEPNVDLQAGRVDLQLSARYTPATTRNGRLEPVDKEWRGTNHVQLNFPPKIRLAEADDGDDDTVAEIGVKWTVEGDVRITPQLLPPTPFAQGPPSREPFERQDGVKLMENMFWPHTIGLDYWQPTLGRQSVFVINKIFPSTAFGEPPQTIAWHLRNTETLWLIPVRLVMSDDVKVYGFGIYKAVPGEYDGPPPMPPGETVDQDEDIAATDDGGGDTVSGTTGTGTAATDEGDDQQTGSTTAETAPDAQQPPPDPDTLDPDRDDRLAALIHQWLGVAEPPENATLGANLRYTKWGVKVGTVPGGVIEAAAKPDDAGAKTPETYCWSKRTALDSVNHCTLEEYVLAELSGRSQAHCRARYKPKDEIWMPDLQDMPVTAARRKALLTGLKVQIRIGDLADSLDKAHTVQAQLPYPRQTVDVGSEVTLRIRKKPAIVPNVLSLSAADAVKALEDAGFKADVKIEGNAPTATAVHTVHRQAPEQQASVVPGSTIQLSIHGPVRQAVKVPDCRRMTLNDALDRLNRAGLRGKEALRGAAPSADQERHVYQQDPKPGVEVEPKTEVRLTAYGSYVPPKIAVPDCAGLSIDQAIAKVKAAGLKPHRRTAGDAARNEAQENRVWGHFPLAGYQVEKGSLVQLFVPPPVPRVKMPTCVGLRSGNAKKRLRDLGLTPVVNEVKTPPSAAKADQIWKQQPAAGTELKKGARVGLWHYGEAPRPQLVRVPDMKGLPAGRAGIRLRRLGLTAGGTADRHAPSADQTGRVWKQTPSAGSDVKPGSKVVLHVYLTPRPQPAPRPPQPQPDPDPEPDLPGPDAKPVLGLVFPPFGGAMSGYLHKNKIFFGHPTRFDSYMVWKGDSFYRYSMDGKLIQILKKTWRKENWDSQVRYAIGGKVVLNNEGRSLERWHAVIEDRIQFRGAE